MTHARTALAGCLFASALALGACSMTPMTPASRAMMARLYGASEVPPTSSRGSGTADVNLNRQTNVLSWTVTYSGLTGPATGGHFHGPADAGQNAGVVFRSRAAWPARSTAWRPSRRRRPPTW